MEYEDKLEKLYEIKKKMKLIDYCNSMAACLSSQYGEYEEYCDGCAFQKYCVMEDSPDTMLEDFLMNYNLQALKESKEFQDAKVAKYDKIVKIIKDK